METWNSIASFWNFAYFSLCKQAVSSRDLASFCPYRFLVILTVNMAPVSKNEKKNGLRERKKCFFDPKRSQGLPQLPKDISEQIVFALIFRGKLAVKLQAGYILYPGLQLSRLGSTIEVKQLSCTLSYTLRGINISHLGKFGKSSTQNAIFGGICDRSLEGILFPSIWPNLIYFTNMDFPEMRKCSLPKPPFGGENSCVRSL